MNEHDEDNERWAIISKAEHTLKMTMFTPKSSQETFRTLIELAEQLMNIKEESDAYMQKVDHALLKERIKMLYENDIMALEEINDEARKQLTNELGYGRIAHITDEQLEKETK